MKETEDAMRDADEQWVADLAARSHGLVPDVPVDIAAALRGGRRRRTQRRAVGGGALFAVVVGAGLGIPALERPTTVPGVVDSVTDAPPDDVVYAEIVDTIPACEDPTSMAATPTAEASPSWRDQAETHYQGPANGMGVFRPTLPREGAVPPDFEPVLVLTCHFTAPDGPDVVPEPVGLEGDLSPLLAFLAQPEPVVPGATDPQCQFDYWLGPPRLYLVDNAGRVIAPHWPVDRCGRAAEQGFGLLDELEYALWGVSEDGRIVTGAALAETFGPQTAEIADTIPACHDLGETPSGLPRPGAVPPGFAPVLVAYCDDQGVAGWEQQMLEGDLRPLLEFLAQPSSGRSQTGGCTYEYTFPPQVYLVDQDGRAIAPDWPSDGCGHPAPQGEVLLDALDEVSAFDEVTKLAP